MNKKKLLIIGLVFVLLLIVIFCLKLSSLGYSAKPLRVIRYDKEMSETIKIKNGGRSERYYLVNEKDYTFIRQILANRIWDIICDDSDNIAFKTNSELVILQDEYGNEKMYVYCPDAVGQDCLDLGEAINAGGDAVDYFTFLQFTYAYKNVYENIKQINNSDGSNSVIPGRVEYSFGILPNALEYKAYHYEGRVIPFEDVYSNNDDIRTKELKDRWSQLRASVLSDEAVTKLIDKYAKLVAFSDFAEKSGIYKDDSDFEAEDYYLDYVNQFKEEQLRRLDNIDKYYRGEIVSSADGFLAGYELEADAKSEINPDDLLPQIKINTVTGSMKFIDEKRGNSEPGTISFVDDTGVDTTCDFSWMRAKGHSSFVRSDKKNYLIQFDDEINILGLGNSQQFVLVANALDPARIRNALAYTLGREFQIPNTTQYRYINLYLNDSYNGLYLLVIPPHAADAKYLFEVNSDENRFTYGHSYFKDDDGLRYEMDYPKEPLSKEVLAISQQINKINELIKLSEDDNAAYETLSTLIDIESFEKMYFLQMILDDVDANRASTYYYFDANRVLHAGPIWDYDLSLGNYGKVHDVYGDSSFPEGMCQKLSNNELFYKRLCSDWKNIYRDKCMMFADITIPQIYESIEPSLKYEVMRWEGMDSVLSTKTQQEAENDKIRNFIYKRIELLDNKLGFSVN